MVNYAELSDIELHAYIVEGNIEAEEVLTERYIRLPRSVARRSELFLKGAEHEDLIQEGTIGLIKAIRTYDPSNGTAFVTYAYRCIENRLLSAVRFADGKSNLPMNHSISINELIQNALEENTASDSITSDPELLLVSKENLEEIRHAIEIVLNNEERVILQLYLDGHSYREIAETIGKEIKYTDNAIQRIRKKLRRAINFGEISLN